VDTELETRRMKKFALDSSKKTHSAEKGLTSFRKKKTKKVQVQTERLIFSGADLLGESQGSIRWSRAGRRAGNDAGRLTSLNPTSRCPNRAVGGGQKTGNRQQAKVCRQLSRGPQKVGGEGEQDASGGADNGRKTVSAGENVGKKKKC